MKKYCIIFILLLTLTSCKEKETYNIDKIEAQKDYVLFDNIPSKLDIKSAGLSTYNYEAELAFLLDISKESDYEKYFYKNYTDSYIEIPEIEIVKVAQDFLNNGVSITSAYKYIAHMYKNKSYLLDITPFDLYCFPEYSFEGNADFLAERNKCYESFQKGAELYRQVNLGLLKARNMLLYALDNQLKNEKDKIKAEAHLYIALSYLAQDELYQILKIKKHAALWKELGGKKVTLFSSEKNKELNELLTYVAYNENTGVIEILKDGIDKGFIDIVLSSGGVYNYLNDNFYLPVKIVSISNNKYAVNPFFTEYHDVREVMDAFLLLSNQVDNNDPAAYNVRNKFEKLYDNPVYILPLNEVVYIVEMKNHRPLNVEFFNPAYFDTSYGGGGFPDSDKMPLISNEYGYDMIQKDYISYKNGKGEFVWNGDIKDQQPDKSKLFSLRNIMDCLHGNDERLEYFCTNRGRLIRAKYEHDNYKCKDKPNCFITVDDMIKRGDFHE